METKEVISLAYPEIKNHHSYNAWLYWEGDCPAWILKCRETVLAHVGNQVRLVTPNEFNALWKKDRDIDLSVLCVAHRADFIRAYLLVEYGGIWIDSDCLVMQSLVPLFELLNQYDFVGYRERNEAVTNNFIGTRPGSIIAKAYYEKICDILRSGQKLEWLAIGSDALTATIDHLDLEWYELNVEQIQPICWSNPEAFFQVESDEQHSKHLNENSYCYMISANMVNEVIRKRPEESLLQKNSFFNFLYNESIRRSMFSKMVFRKNTDDDRWVIPEVMEQDMYRIKEFISTFAPSEKEYIIDCGAHIGAFSMMCAQYIENVEVIAFEPNPDNFKYLSENAKNFEKIEVIHKAVGIDGTYLSLYEPNQNDWTGRWSTIPNGNKFITVESVNLFSFIKNLDSEVFILKLDLVGYEEFIFANSKKEDFVHVKIIMLEIHSDRFDHQRILNYGYRLLFQPTVSSHRQFVYERMR